MRSRPLWERKLIFMCRSGSHAYGMATPESDVDLRGVCVLDKKRLYGIQRFDQYAPEAEKGNDICIYGLPKFISLLVKCNPNVIELLAIDEEDILCMHPLMEQLRANLDLFVTKKAKHTFAGYAFSQLNSIKKHRGYLLNPLPGPPSRSDFGLPEHRSAVNADELNAFMWLTTRLLEQTAAGAKLSQATKDELAEIDWTGMVQSADLPPESGPIIQKLTSASETYVQAVMAERAYRNALKKWQAFEGWKKRRNDDRAKLEKKYGYDTKHASHLCRLLSMGVEILTGKGVIVKRPDAEWLLSIRRGAMAYEQLLEWAEEKEREINKAEKLSTLPHSPDMKKIEDLQMDLVENGLLHEVDLYMLRKFHQDRLFGENYEHQL
jgi:predicted nucleotidyltransferase